MDLVPLIDLVGEVEALFLGIAFIGLVFGFCAQRTAYCTRSAVLDLTRGRDLRALSTWALGFAAAVLAVQLMIHGGMLDARETRFFSTPQSLSGALIGGLIFGCGMVLTRGCVSRLVVLAAGGNLRALFGVLVVAIFGLATYSGILIPLRDPIAGLLSTNALGGNDLLQLGGLGGFAGVLIGLAIAVLAAALAVVSRISPLQVAGAILVGLSVAAGWYFTYQISMQVFDPVQIESLSYIRPLALSGEWLFGGAFTGFDQGLVAGTLVGGFLAALLFRQLRFVWFGEAGAPSMLRYAGGAAMMGFGGILAVGCTVGAGLTGGSVLAVSSLVGLASMMVGAAVTDRLVDLRRDTQG